MALLPMLLLNDGGVGAPPTDGRSSVVSPFLPRKNSMKYFYILLSHRVPPRAAALSHTLFFVSRRRSALNDGTYVRYGTRWMVVVAVVVVLYFAQISQLFHRNLGHKIKTLRKLTP